MAEKNTKNINSKYLFFIFILLVMVLLGYFLYDLFATINIFGKLIFGVIILFIIFIFVLVQTKSILFLEEYERAVIFRFGRLHRVGGPGWAFVWPWIETFKNIDLRTETIDIPKQEVITKGNIMLIIDAVIYLHVGKKPENIINSVLNIDDYREASELFVKSKLRDVVGGMKLEDVISNIGKLNSTLKQELINITKDWGVEVETVAVKEIKIPDEVMDAMHKEKVAVQNKLATIEFAEGEKQKINAINEAAQNLSDKSIAYYYIKALEEMSKGASSKIIFPMEFNRFANIISGRSKPSNDSEKASVDNFLNKYGPLLNKYLKKVEKEETKKK